MSIELMLLCGESPILIAFSRLSRRPRRPGVRVSSFSPWRPPRPPSAWPSWWFCSAAALRSTSSDLDTRKAADDGAWRPSISLNRAGGGRCSAPYWPVCSASASDGARGPHWITISGVGRLVRCCRWSCSSTSCTRQRRRRCLQPVRVHLGLVEGEFRMEGRLPDRRSLTAVMMAVVTFVSLLVHIYTIGYMHDDPGYQRFFSLYLAVYLRHADAGHVEQLPAAVLRLGRGRPGVLPADRFLVHPKPDRDITPI